VLKDVNKQGNLIDWRGKKLDSIELSNSYIRLEMESKAERTATCGDFLQFKEFLDTNKNPKLHKSNFCKVRLCPMCSWRRSLKLFGQVSQVMDYLEKNHNFRYLFLTLTVKNCYSEDFKETLDLMTKAFNKMTNRKDFKGSIKGYFRALEVTYDSERFITQEMYFKKLEYFKGLGLEIGDKNPNFDTYHPHFHIILAVNPSYFTDKNYYISQKEWGKVWGDCLGVDYDPIIDIRAVKNNNKKEVAEVAKYTVKSDDFLIKENGKINELMTDKVVKTLDLGLHRKRLVSFGFIFKDIHKELNLDDAIDGDLVHTDSEVEEIEGLNYVLVNYIFDKARRNYFKLN
jgi:plasmid rolling circle replication initiator protein Rep